MKKISKTSLVEAYTAGFLDGEGYFRIARKYKKKNVYFSIKIMASQKYQSHVLDYLRALWGGSISKRSKDGVRIWHMSSKNVWLCLNQIIPFLVVKRKQAELMVDFWRLDIDQKEKVFEEYDFRMKALKREV